MLFVVVGVASCTPQTIAPRCSFSDFEAAPYDHLIEGLPTVTGAELIGRLKIRPSEIEGGVWPEGLDARIELHGPNGFRELIEPNADGSFVRRHLRPGTYCFKLSASGFRSMLGTIVIDRTSRQSALLEVELMISE